MKKLFIALLLMMGSSFAFGPAQSVYSGLYYFNPNKVYDDGMDSFHTRGWKLSNIFDSGYVVDIVTGYNLNDYTLCNNYNSCGFYNNTFPIYNDAPEILADLSGNVSYVCFNNISEFNSSQSVYHPSYSINKYGYNFYCYNNLPDGYDSYYVLLIYYSDDFNPENNIKFILEGNVGDGSGSSDGNGSNNGGNSGVIGSFNMGGWSNSGNGSNNGNQTINITTPSFNTGYSSPLMNDTRLIQKTISVINNSSSIIKGVFDRVLSRLGGNIDVQTLDFIGFFAKNKIYK